MFIIKYRQNPIHYHNSNSVKVLKAKKQIIRSFHNLNYKITCMRHRQNCRINVDKNYRRIIRGLGQIYGFKPKSFINDNFIIKRHHTYLKPSHHLMTIESWLKIIQQIQYQLQRINTTPDSLNQIQAKYHGFVYINGIYVNHSDRIANHARKRLAKLGNNQRYRFTGRYARFGRKSNGQLSLLLKHITYRRKEVTDHLWFSYTQGFRKLGHLKTRQKINFLARVKRYRKGYVPEDFVKHYDYKLSYPSQIIKL